MRRVTVNPGRGARIFGPGPGAYTNIFTGPITVEGEFVEVIEEDLDAYVNVKLMDGTSYQWTYRDLSGFLEVGDIVEVPFGYSNAARIAKVVSLGKGYDGPMRIKNVTARLEREVL